MPSGSQKPWTLTAIGKSFLRQVFSLIVDAVFLALIGVLFWLALTLASLVRNNDAGHSQCESSCAHQ